MQQAGLLSRSTGDPNSRQKEHCGPKDKNQHALQVRVAVDAGSIFETNMRDMVLVAGEWSAGGSNLVATKCLVSQSSSCREHCSYSPPWALVSSADVSNPTPPEKTFVPRRRWLAICFFSRNGGLDFREGLPACSSRDLCDADIDRDFLSFFNNSLTLRDL